MTAKVCDASAIAAILFGEPGFEGVAARLEGHLLVAPSLLPYELANIGIKKARRHTAEAKLLAEFLDYFKAMDVHLHDVRAQNAFELARKMGLSGYDASYLWLARELDIELVTLDKQLERAATE